MYLFGLDFAFKIEERVENVNFGNYLKIWPGYALKISIFSILQMISRNNCWKSYETKTS